MYPKQHLFLGAIFATALFLLFPKIGFLGASLVLISSILIDIDHYLYYVYKKRDFNLKNAYFWIIGNGKAMCSLPKNKRNQCYMEFFFLHGIEILLILFLLIKFSNYFLFIFAGVSFHLILDITHQTTYVDRIDRFSVIYDFFKYKKLTQLERGKNI